MKKNVFKNYNLYILFTKRKRNKINPKQIKLLLKYFLNKGNNLMTSHIYNL
jgi:hypothetical protein